MGGGEGRREVGRADIWGGERIGDGDFNPMKKENKTFSSQMHSSWVKPLDVISIIILLSFGINFSVPLALALFFPICIVLVRSLGLEFQLDSLQQVQILHWSMRRAGSRKVSGRPKIIQ